MLAVVALGILDSLGIVLDFVPALNLAWADDSGAYGKHLALRRRIELDEVRIFRTRPDQVHVADENIEKLRQLVELGPAQELAQARNPRVTLDGQPRTHQVGAVDHRPELVDEEGLTETTDAALAKEDRPRRVELDQHRNQDEKRKQAKDPGQ